LKYKDFFSVCEYDGYESVCILYYKYKLHQIQAAVDAQSDKLKIKQVGEDLT
jgi:hypothetical protein